MLRTIALLAACSILTACAPGATAPQAGALAPLPLIAHAAYGGIHVPLAAALPSPAPINMEPNRLAIVPHGFSLLKGRKCQAQAYEPGDILITPQSAPKLAHILGVTTSDGCFEGALAVALPPGKPPTVTWAIYEGNDFLFFGNVNYGVGFARVLVPYVFFPGIGPLPCEYWLSEGSRHSRIGVASSRPISHRPWIDIQQGFAI
jgi:hypothetical protein